MTISASKTINALKIRSISNDIYQVQRPLNKEYLFLLIPPYLLQIDSNRIHSLLLLFYNLGPSFDSKKDIRFLLEVRCFCINLFSGIFNTNLGTKVNLLWVISTIDSCLFEIFLCFLPLFLIVEIGYLLGGVFQYQG